MPIEIQELTIKAVVESAARVVEVDSTKLEDDVDGQLSSAMVIDRLHMPDTFTLVFHDPERDILERAQLAIGKRVKISTGGLTAEAAAVLIDGEVTSIEVEYDTTGSRAIVRGYDLSHHLTAGRKSKTFQGSTYSDIAREIAGGANLETDIEATREVHDHVIQANQSDLDFLMQLAREVDYAQPARAPGQQAQDRGGAFDRLDVLGQCGRLGGGLTIWIVDERTAFDIVERP